MIVEHESGAANSVELGLLDGAHRLGENVLEFAQFGFQKLRKAMHMAEYTTTSALAIGGGVVGAAVFEGYNASSANAEAAPHVIHLNSNDVDTQTVLDDIRHIAMPCNPAVGCVKWLRHSNMSDLHPISAYIYPSSIGFSALCNQMDSQYKIWDINAAGTQFTSCPGLGGGIPTTFPKSIQNEYQSKLNSLGNSLEHKAIDKEQLQSMGLGYSKKAKSIRGTLHEVVAIYDCASNTGASSSSTNTSKYVEKVIIQRAFKTVRANSKSQKEYSKISVVVC